LDESKRPLRIILNFNTALLAHMSSPATNPTEISHLFEQEWLFRNRLPSRRSGEINICVRPSEAVSLAVSVASVVAGWWRAAKAACLFDVSYAFGGRTGAWN